MTTFLLVALALVAVAVLLAASRSGLFRVERSVHIAAPPERILPLISDLRKFNTWNPFSKEQALQLTYTGPASGSGAGYAFAGSGAAGRGTLTVTAASADAVSMRLCMTAPVRCENHLDFTLTSAAGGTDVRWAMHGRSPFIAKLMGVVVNTDRMIGRELEVGLAALRERCAMAEAA